MQTKQILIHVANSTIWRHFTECDGILHGILVKSHKYVKLHKALLSIAYTHIHCTLP